MATYTYSRTYDPADTTFYQVSGIIFKKVDAGNIPDNYSRRGNFMFGNRPIYETVEPKITNVVIQTAYTKWGDTLEGSYSFRSPVGASYSLEKFSIAITDANPSAPFTVVSVSMDITMDDNSRALPEFDYEIAIQGVKSQEFTGENIVSFTSNQYSILIGAAAGPIERINVIKVGSTPVWNSAGTVEGLSNIATGWTPGISNSEIQYNFARPSISATIAFDEADIASGVYTMSPDKSSGITEANDLVYISNYDNLQLRDLFSRIHYTFQLSAANALDFRSSNFAIDIPLDSIEGGATDADFMPTDIQFVLNFPAGLYNIKEKDGSVIKTSFNFALVYLDENKNQLTTETSYAVKVTNLAGKEYNGSGSNWVGSSTAPPGTTEDNAGDFDYHQYSFSSQSKAGLKIPITITRDVPSTPNARYLRIWRIIDDAYGEAPHGGYPNGSGTNASSYKVSFCELSKYQLGYDSIACTYAGTALVGVLTTANSGLNNYYPAVTTELFGRVVDWIPNCRPDESPDNYMRVFNENYIGTATWDEGLYGTLNTINYKRGFTSNPVWCLFDLLLDREDGLGNYIDEESIDLESFFEAAKWCDEKIKHGELWAYTSETVYEKITDNYMARYSLNMTVEMNMPVYSVIQAILLAFRGLLFWRDGTYVLKVDKEDSVSQVLNDTQVTDIAINITSLQKLPNTLVVNFNDIEKGLTQTSLYLEDHPTIAASDGQIKEKQMTLAGVNNKYQATSIAKYHMYTNRNINKNLTFTASLDLLTADVWDVIRLHTNKFLNKATYSAKIDSIVATGTPGQFTVTTKTPIMLFDTEVPSVTHRWNIQSYYGGSINLFPLPNTQQTATFHGSVPTNTSITTFDIVSSDNALDTKLQENDVFTVIGDSDSYSDWRIVGMKVNPTKNTVQVMCVNYVDAYYPDLDVYELAKDWAIKENVNQIKLGSDFDINSEINPLSVKFSAEPKFDELNRILKVDLVISIPGLADNLQDMYTLVIYGGLSDAPMRLLQSYIYPSETIFKLPNIDLGNWTFQFQVADKYGRTHLSRKIEKTIDSTLFFEDTDVGGGVEDPVTRNLLVPIVYNFTDEYIRLKWENIPTIITAIDIEFTDGIDSAVRSYQVVPDSNGDFQIEQLVYDLTEITNNKNATFYSLYIGYWDAFGGYWPTVENKDQSLYLVSNPPPITPYSGLFYYKQSYHTITVYPVQSNIRNYITAVNDFAGFTIFIGADAVSDADFSFSDPSTYVGIDNPLLGTITFGGTILVSQQVDYDPDTEAVGITVFDLYEFMGVNNTLTINIWVMAIDIFGQTSQPFNLGQVQIYKVENVVNTELIPAAIGDTLSTNLIKNSSFDGWKV